MFNKDLYEKFFDGEFIIARENEEDEISKYLHDDWHEDGKIQQMIEWKEQGYIVYTMFDGNDNDGKMYIGKGIWNVNRVGYFFRKEDFGDDNLFIELE